MFIKDVILPILRTTPPSLASCFVFSGFVAGMGGVSVHFKFLFAILTDYNGYVAADHWQSLNGCYTRLTSPSLETNVGLLLAVG
jgi:hypothetical protein